MPPIDARMPWHFKLWREIQKLDAKTSPNSFKDSFKVFGLHTTAKFNVQLNVVSQNW